METGLEPGKFFDITMPTWRLGEAILGAFYIGRALDAVDSPYGPYADNFSAEQHRLGPFGPIRAKVKELASESRTVNAGRSDGGSRWVDDMR